MESLAVHVFINSHIDIKKNSDSDSDVNGTSNCHKMYIDMKNETSLDLGGYMGQQKSPYLYFKYLI